LNSVFELARLVAELGFAEHRGGARKLVQVGRDGGDLFVREESAADHFVEGVEGFVFALLVALANGSDYGLASGIWTSDVSKALRVAERLDAGTVWINTYGMFDVAVPFGGRKHSGFGKELGEEALEPYLHSKSVWVDLTAAVPQSGQGITR